MATGNNEVNMAAVVGEGKEKAEPFLILLTLTIFEVAPCKLIINAAYCSLTPWLRPRSGPSHSISKHLQPVFQLVHP